MNPYRAPLSFFHPPRISDFPCFDASHALTSCCSELTAFALAKLIQTHAAI